ncbi:uncharacterized oxidoreductase YjmC-like [Oscarella lobularis]|uniref:uncharacterized oxidoreductase YjmC-like n=1 Tax=Oscarella lobularis TaxID=121494 RepID=UPI003313B571
MLFWRSLRRFFSATTSSSERIVPADEVRSFVVRCMGAVGTKASHAESLAELLVTADERGHYSHGLNRLEMYVHDVECKVTAIDAEPVVANETPATAFVDGRNVLGPVAGTLCMEKAISKARDVGVSWVVCTASNHYGIAGWYAIKAANEGLIGMSFTNTSPLQVPTRSRQVALGTNPIAFAAPGVNGDHFVLDMATSTAAIGKVELHQRKEIPIPTGWGVDSKGNESRSPDAILHGGGLSPLGGTEASSGYKGYGLATMVEIFCGILAGSAYGPNIRRWMGTEEEANLGQSFAAINPTMFAPDFSERLADLLKILRTLQPAEGESEVLVAGDPERRHLSKIKDLGGIPYHVNMFPAMDKLADKLNVKRMVPKAT